MRQIILQATTAASRLKGVLCALILLVATGVAAQAQDDPPRIALIVGNGSYSSVTALDNPVPDAELMAETLQNALVNALSQYDTMPIDEVLGRRQQRLESVGRFRDG